MCFKLNIFHDNLTDIVYEHFFPQKYCRLVTEEEPITDSFCRENLISKIFKKWSLPESRFDKNRTIVYNPKLF